ncbi:protein kinase family protein [Chthonomonas calidirosea]|uniref:non-specific serine/threonine protein kinase n=1 Tax=Chthonomonas calidirosea (strain DSM 23976 / ICMP 18418 / T49) TaxID=1303518 RepID=S0EVR2_CHTCT|nr:serine/threonine-protein kinase [Chthonomonas calidirosea]CCW34472.1 Protein kinase domain [Chthonomonas calidirosea T49]CEK14686.1 protein kinase family protein [Chthonomonas calidirosea]
MSDLFGDLFEGQVLDGKYHLRQRIGVGGYGAVFLADEVVAGRVLREVVVKLFRVAEEHREQQLRELQTSTTLHHPNLIRYFAPGQFTYSFQNKAIPMLYLVMERADESLEQRLKRGLLTPEEAETLLRQMCDVLLYLHERPEHWVHRDVKPANILWSEGRWKLADLGLMRELGPRGDMTTATTVMGTPAYAPPEAFRNYVTPAWDIWSLGVVLVEALTGHLPFEGQSIEEKIHAVLHLPPSHLHRLPEPFRTIAEGCLEKNPRDRLTPRGVLALLDAPPKPPQTEISWRSLVKAAAFGGGSLLVLRGLLSFWLPGGSRWNPLFLFPERSSLWYDPVIRSWSPSYFYALVAPYMAFGAVLEVAVLWILYRVLGTFGKTQWLLFPISLLISLVCILLCIGGLSFLFHVPLVTAHDSLGWIVLVQQATLLGLRYLAFGAALSGLLFVSLGDSLASAFCFLGITVPALAWGALGVIGGAVVGGFRKGALPEVEELRRWWRIGTASILALIALVALIAQKTVFSNPTFVQRWVWTTEGSRSPVTLAGRWQGVLEGQRVRVILEALGSNRFMGKMEGLPGHVTARVEGRLNGNSVVLKIVPRAGRGRIRQFKGYIDASSKTMQGWERERQGRRVMWWLKRS